MVRWATGCLRHHARKTQRSQIKLVDKGLNDTDRIVFADVVVQAFRQQDELLSILALYKTLHRSPPGLPPRVRVSDQAFSHGLDLKRALAALTQCPRPRRRAELLTR